MTDLGIQEFDSADCLTSAERLAAYIQVVADETDDDVRAIVGAFAVAVRARGGAATGAADAGMSVEELRAGFVNMVADPAFQEKKLELLGDYEMVTGADVDAAVAQLIDFPEDRRNWLLDFMVNNLGYTDRR
jgi:DNA-binding phage protein